MLPQTEEQYGKRWKSFPESFADFLPARRRRFAGQTVTFIRTNIRKNGSGFRTDEREKCLVRSHRSLELRNLLPLK